MAKTGLITWRVDNPYISNVEGALMPLITIIENYNGKVQISANLESTIIRSGQQYKLTDYKAMQNRGHAIVDHTPSDSNDYFKIPPGYEDVFTPYVGNGIVEIIDGPHHGDPYPVAILERHYVKELSEYKIGGDNAYTITQGTDEVTGDFSMLSGQNYYLYIDNLIGDKIGWKPCRSVTDSKVVLKQEYGDYVTFEATENLSMYASGIGNDACVLTEEATYLLFLAGQCWFEYMDLTKADCYIHPGGLWARIENEYAMSAMERLEMAFADTYDNVDTILTYNYNRDNKYAAHSWNSPGNELDLSTHFTNGTIAITKNYIADAIARNWHITLKSHFDYATMPGADEAEKIQNYYDAVEEFMQWAFNNNLTFVTYAEMRNLMIDSPVGKYENIIPNLYTDISTQGKPDGYTMGVGAIWERFDGVSTDNNSSIKLNGNGELARITNLGGLEKGRNKFYFYMKGAIGATLQIQFGSIGTATFTITETGWNRYEISNATGLNEIVIPYTTNFLDVVYTAYNNDGNDIFISGSVLLKNAPMRYQITHIRKGYQITYI